MAEEPTYPLNTPHSTGQTECPSFQSLFSDGTVFTTAQLCPYLAIETIHTLEHHADKVFLQI